MTREQKIEAFTMRIDGYSFNQIAEKFGVSRQAIQQILRYSISTTKKKNFTYNCSAISDYLYLEEMSLDDLSKMVGVSYGYLSHSLRSGNISFKLAQKLSNATNIPIRDILSDFDQYLLKGDIHI